MAGPSVVVRFEDAVFGYPKRPPVLDGVTPSVT